LRIFRLPYVLLTAGFLALGLSAGVVRVLQLDWYANHKALNTRIGDIDWIGYYFRNGLLQIRNDLFANSRPGLPKVRFYIPVSAQIALMENPPDSTKKWKEGFMLYPDGSPKKIKVRHRGDNPLNWLFTKKSLRIKTRKKNLLNGSRSFNYNVPQSPSMMDLYFGYKLATDAGVSAPSVRLVEAFINDKPYGVLIEYEKHGETFLRNSGYMPVNLYKGEQAHIERSESIELDLFNNPSHWQKVAYGNDLPANNKSDIEFFLDLIRQATVNEEALSKLKRVAPFSIWARYAAYQVLAQNAHNAGYNNQRLIFDPWRGEVHPSVNDPHYLEQGWKGPWRSRDHPEMQNGETGKRVRADFEIDSHSLLRIYNRNSAFLYEKYRFLYGFLTEERLLKGAHNQIKKLSDPLIISAERDPDIWFSKSWSGFPFASPATELRKFLDTILRDTVDLEEYLIGQLRAQPNSRWRTQGNNLFIQIDGHVPMNGVRLRLPLGASVPKTIAWDTNGDGRLDKDDMIIPFKFTDGNIELDAVWLANRTTVDAGRYRHTSDYPRVRIDPRATRFVLVADVPLEPLTVTARNAISDKTYPIPKGDMEGAWPGRFNLPILPNSTRQIEVWSGETKIDGTRFIDAPVRIEAGTVIRMAPRAKVIFRNTIEIAGTIQKPVIITPAQDGKPFGFIALQGQGTAGSSIQNLHMTGGTGGRVENIQYTAMLNIHNTRDIELSNLKLSDNKIYDDMLHIVYCDDVRIDGIDLRNAHSDAADIDISTGVRFLGGTIKGSGNDGIDLMSSVVTIEGMVLSENKDKGVSVGEATEVVIRKSRIENNKIGIETKDGSRAQVLNTSFNRNTTQLYANMKNWRYGSGGRIEVRDSVLTDDNNIIKVDKKSTIRVTGSQMAPLVKPSKGVVFENVRARP
jgi:hypothetical protein